MWAFARVLCCRTFVRVRETCVIQFVTIRETGIGRRPKHWNGKMASTGEVKGEARYAYAPGRSPAVFLFGRMGHWNRDRDCESAQLIVAARMGGLRERTPPRTERRNPAPAAPATRGFAIGRSCGATPGGGGRRGAGRGLR